MKKSNKRKFSTAREVEFKHYSKLPEELQLHVLDFVSTTAFLTQVAPLVSKQFNAWAIRDQFWGMCHGVEAQKNPIWDDEYKSLLGSSQDTEDTSLRTLFKKCLASIRVEFPMFYMDTPGLGIGQEIQLHLFEPRYRYLIHESCNGHPTDGTPMASPRPRFFYVPSNRPEINTFAFIVEVVNAMQFPDLRAFVSLQPVACARLTDVWYDSNRANLFYATAIKIRNPRED